MKKYLLAIGAMYLVLAARLPAQTTDIELWTGGSLNLKMSKRVTVQPEQVFKFNDTIRHFKSAYSDLGIKYKLSRAFGVGAGYRYIENPPGKNAQRFSGDLIFNFRAKQLPLSFQSRLRFQHEVRNIDKNKEDYLRNKFTLDYNLSKWADPYISFEPFYRFNGKNEFRVLRYTLGFDFKLIKNLSLTSFYMLQKDINSKKLANTHIGGLMLSYDIITYGNTPKMEMK